MSRKKRKYKRRPSFIKHYKSSLQDDLLIEQECLLQKVHTELAKELFSQIPTKVFGDWTLKSQGLTIFIDPELGVQLEISGTSSLPFYERLLIHLKFFKLLKEGYSILKAVKICLLTLMKQSAN